MRQVTILTLKRATILALGMAGAGLALAPAWAQDTGSTLPPTDDACRVATIPAHTRVVQRVEQVPPVYSEQRVPTFETVQVPVYETRRVPIYETVEQPVFEEREEPIYRTEEIPVWGEKEVTVYRRERRPVTVELWNPFECEDFEVELWDRCKDVPCGTKRVAAIVGHEQRSVADGTRMVREQVGSQPQQVLTGYREERTQVGEREQSRQVGWTTRRVLTEPARTHTIQVCESVPATAVTVIADGTRRDEPLAGTLRIMTESEYRDALAQVDAR